MLTIRPAADYSIAWYRRLRVARLSARLVACVGVRHGARCGTRTYAFALALLAGCAHASFAYSESAALAEQNPTEKLSSQWQWLAPSSDGSVLTARHEAASVVIGDSIYLVGGRQNRPVERYSTSTGEWENLGLAPLEMHHFQPVAIGSRIYLTGAFTCCYPREAVVADVYTFDTETASWDVVGSMPVSRARGSTAAAVHEGKIYVLGGNTQGHDGGAVAWFDEFDPETGIWRELADAPNARDHFSMAVIGGKLIAASGRQTRMPNPAANPVAQTDVYDFSTGQWTVSADIPTARGGAVAVPYGDELIVAGGEINTASSALDIVEAYDSLSGTWRSLPSMKSGRHGSGGGVLEQRLFMLSGASSLGGATETTSSEFLLLPDLEDEPVVVTRSSTGGSAGFWFLLVAGICCVLRSRAKVSLPRRSCARR